MLTSEEAAPAVEGQQQQAQQPEQEQAEETKQEDPAFAKRFAALTRREREIQRKAQEAAERERSLAEREAKYSAWEQARERAKDDPLGYLKESGLTYKQITDKILEDEDLSPEQKAERIAQAKIDEYAKQQEERAQKEREEREKADKEVKEAKLIADYKSRIGAVISEGGDDYELINFEGDNGSELVFEVASQHFDETGEIMDPKAAADHVEKYLEKRYKEVLNTKKLSQLRDLAPDETQQGDNEPTGEAPRTLTNRATLSSSSSSDTSSRYLSDEESKAAAAEMLRKALAAQS